jgi:hypothetical protein
MSVRFYLKPSKQAIAERLKSELVYASVSQRFGLKVDGNVSYKKFEYSLETYVKPHHFGTVQTKRGATNIVYHIPTIEKYKTHTADVRQAILDFENDLKDVSAHFRKLGSKPTAIEYKGKLEAVRGRERGQRDTTSLVKFIITKIDELKGYVGTGHADKVSSNTIDNYNSLLQLLKGYEAFFNIILTFDNLESYYSRLWNFQDEVIKGNIVETIEGKRKKAIDPHGVATNTIINYQCNLRKFIGYAIDKKIKVDESLLRLKIHKVQKSSRQYDVNNSDLLAIYNHNPSTERLQIAKDYIIFSSLVGTRYQSVMLVDAIKTYDRKGLTFPYVHTIQGKTATECYTPLFAPAREIMERNGNKLPDFSKYTGTLNKQIKDLYTEIGLTYPIQVTKHYLNDGEVVTSESVATIVSSHCTRKGFVTNLYKYGIETDVSNLVTHPKKGTNGSDYNKATLEVRALDFYKKVVANLESNDLYRF